MPPYGTVTLIDENIDGSCPTRMSGIYPVDDPSDTSIEMVTGFEEIVGHRMDLVDKPCVSEIDLCIEIGYTLDPVKVTWSDGDFDHRGRQSGGWKPLS
jgi:hypothetical protein